MIAYVSSWLAPTERWLSPAPTQLHSRICRRPRLEPKPRYRRVCAMSIQDTLSSSDLETRAKDIDPCHTDSLQAQVDEELLAGSALSGQLLESMVIHLADSRGMARLGLVEAFGRVGSKAVPYLLAGLKFCPNPVVRRSCGKALAKIGDPSATDALLHTLVHDDDTVTRSSAAGALARMGRLAVLPLLQLIADPEISMTAKGHATWAISFMQGEAADALFNSLQHPNLDVRVAVVSALGAVAIGDALPAMAAVSDDDWGDDDTGKTVLRERAVDAMRKALSDDSPEVRAEAATALANAGCSEEAGRVADMLQDENEELRRCAALALMKLGDVGYAELLENRAMDEGEVDTVRNVARLAAVSLRRAADEVDEWRE